MQNSETRTMSMLQRVPVILAVTAASYGLTLHNRNEGMQPQAKAAAQHQAADKAPRR